MEKHARLELLRLVAHYLELKQLDIAQRAISLAGMRELCNILRQKGLTADAQSERIIRDEIVYATDEKDSFGKSFFPPQ